MSRGWSGGGGRVEWGGGGAVSTRHQERESWGFWGSGKRNQYPSEGHRSGLSQEQNLQFLVWLIGREFEGTSALGICIQK